MRNVDPTRPELPEKKLVKKNQKLTQAIFFKIVLIIGLTIGLLFFHDIILQKKVTPQIGIAGAGEPFLLSESNFDLTQKMIDYQLIQFIKNIRTIPDNRDELFKNWQNAQDRTTGKARKKNEDNWRKWEVWNKFLDSFIVYVEVTKIIKMVNNIYEIQWKESKWKETSFYYDSFYYGNFTIEEILPETAEKMIRNPLGFYITDYNLTKTKEL